MTTGSMNIHPHLIQRGETPAIGCKNHRAEMTLSDIEAGATKQAVDLVVKRKSMTTIPRPTSVLCELHRINHENPSLTPYVKNQLINSITKPLAFLFFMNHTPTDEKCVVELADFIETHTASLTVWYEH